MNNVKECSVVFTAEEVNAVLVGKKTQHRMILSSQPYTNDYGWEVLEIGSVRISDQCVTTRPLDEAIKKRLPTTSAAPHRIGDRLWVQEPSLIHCDWCWFYTDNTLVECKEPYTSGDLHLPWDDEHQEYIGPIGAEHMPRWASRLLLEITDIRIERVQDIKLGDSLKEACDGLMDFAVDYWMAKHGEAAWFTNPWVWVIEFKAIENSEVNTNAK